MGARKNRVATDGGLYRCRRRAKSGRIQYYFCFWVFNLYDPIVHRTNIFLLKRITLHFTLKRFRSNCQTLRDVYAFTRYKENYIDPYTSIIQFRMNSLILFVPMFLFVFLSFRVPCPRFLVAFLVVRIIVVFSPPSSSYVTCKRICRVDGFHDSACVRYASTSRTRFTLNVIVRYVVIYCFYFIRAFVSFLYSHGVGVTRFCLLHKMRSLYATESQSYTTIWITTP